MTEAWQAVCASGDLADAGSGVRFGLGGAQQPAFVIRIGGSIRAYLNRCGHIPVELDWPEGQFLDDEARFIQCATHGAIYDPHTGACAGGPCRGQGLVALICEERDGQVWVNADLPAQTS